MRRERVAKGILLRPRGREHRLPFPRAPDCRDLPCERVWKFNETGAAPKIVPVLLPHLVEMNTECHHGTSRQNRYPVATALSAAHGHNEPIQVEILHTQRQRFHQPQPRARRYRNSASATSPTIFSDFAETLSIVSCRVW